MSESSNFYTSFKLHVSIERTNNLSIALNEFDLFENYKKLNHYVMIAVFLKFCHHLSVITNIFDKNSEFVETL